MCMRGVSGGYRPVWGAVGNVRANVVLPTPKPPAISDPSPGPRSPGILRVRFEEIGVIQFEDWVDTGWPHTRACSMSTRARPSRRRRIGLVVVVGEGERPELGERPVPELGAFERLAVSACGPAVRSPSRPGRAVSLGRTPQ
jgi:hypothetical protein